MNTAREIRNIWDEIGRMKTRTAGSASGAVISFLGLNDTPAAYAGSALYGVRVNAAANALEFSAAADVFGPAGATDNALARFDTATGKLIQDSNAILSNAGELSLEGALFIAEIATPVARPNYGAIYPKDDNILYFQDGAGIEHSVDVDDAGGDVVGPGASTDNALARFHLATGKIIQNSNAILNDAGLLFLAETSNAKMTIGLTINQAANSDEIFAAKSSTIAHGMTTFAETDTYGFLAKANAANGGLDVVGFNDTGVLGVRVRGHGTAMNTTRGTGGVGLVHIFGSKISGTGEGNVDAGSNILSVACMTGAAFPAVWLVDNTGATWQSGTVWINENANTKMTTGITINQNGADDEIAAFKSSDVAHGCTDYAETDTFISMAKLNAANGGMALNGFTVGAVGVGVRGFFGADNTTKSIAGAAAVCVYGYKISGTGITNSSADQNIFAIRTQRGGATETVFIVDENGAVWTDGSIGIKTAAPTAWLHLPAGLNNHPPLKFTAGTALTVPEAGSLEYHDSRIYMTNVATRKALDRTSDVATATVTVANTVVETTMWTGPMPANSLVAGNAFMFHCDGTVSNGGPTAPDQVTIRVYVGVTEIIKLEPKLKTLTNAPWHIDANACQRTIGNPGSRAVHLHLIIGDDEEKEIGVANINTTANMDVTVTAEWASADAANTISLYQGFMRYKN